jgi:cytochrome c5
MKRYLFSALTLALLAGNLLLAAPHNQSEKKEPQQPTAPTNRKPQSDGEEVFQAHCARCHTPPMTISPRITGTIIMHMRTRARLSREDELLLLKYMAP